MSPADPPLEEVIDLESTTQIELGRLTAGGDSVMLDPASETTVHEPHLQCREPECRELYNNTFPVME